MKILVLRVDLKASWVHSLKEKRMVVKSLIKKLQNNFNISICEVSNQDVHQTISIGLSFTALESNQCYVVKEKILNFIEDNTQANIFEIEEEIINY